MNAGKVRIPKRGKAVEPCAGHIAFGTRGFAPEHLAIESNQPFPSLPFDDPFGRGKMDVTNYFEHQRML
jgi:hypothetical protein